MTLSVAVVDDYEVVCAGIARMLEPYSGRVHVVEFDANCRVSRPVDIALYDSFAQGEADHPDLEPLLDDPRIAHLVVYTWNFDAELVAVASARGVSGYLAKSIPAPDLVDALGRINDGEFVVSTPPPPRGRHGGVVNWPGSSAGLSGRESEVLALITQGQTTREMAATLHLSVNSIKTHMQSLYRKIGARTRSQALLWGIEHGFTPDRVRRKNPGSAER